MPSPAEIQAMYDKRDADIEALRNSGKIITVQDLQSLDRLGRFHVASDLFTMCDQAAQVYLLKDDHAHVRSAASISHEKEEKAKAFRVWYFNNYSVEEGVYAFELNAEGGYLLSEVQDAYELFLKLGSPKL